MFRKKKFTFLICFLAAGILFAGCSTSTNSVRYGDKHETEKEDDPSVRFTSDDSTNEIIGEDNYANDEDEFPDETSDIDISSVLTKYNSTGNSADYNADNGTIREKMLMEIIKYLNTPYKYGGNSKDGIDCSAFTQTVFNNSLDLSLLRTARDQYGQGTVIENKQELKFGDLVFFNTRRRVRPGHVGIYIGDNLFAHASSKKGVIISSLDHDYYSKRFMGGRRIENTF